MSAQSRSWDDVIDFIRLIMAAREDPEQERTIAPAELAEIAAEVSMDADKMDGFITAHWQTMGQFDRARKVKLVVDEWGAWHKPGSESDPSHTLTSSVTKQ